MDDKTTRAAPVILDGGSNQFVLLAGSDELNNSTAVRLNKVQAFSITKNLPKSANQQRRFIECLALQPLNHTKPYCRAIGCVNLSDLRQNTAKLLAKFGLEARCSSPDKPIKNGFGEDTNQKLWALYVIKGGAL